MRKSVPGSEGDQDEDVLRDAKLVHFVDEGPIAPT